MSGNDEEINVALTADFSDLTAGMEAGAESVTAGTQTMASAVAESSAAMSKSFQDIIDAQNRQMTSTAELVGVQEGAAAAAGEATIAIEAQTAATTENTAATAINGGVTRELGVMVGELARGNYTRLIGSTTTLANRSGILSAVIEGLLSPLGLTAAAAAALGGAYLSEADDLEKLTLAQINSGNVNGLNRDQLLAIEAQLRSNGASYANASDAVSKLAASGRDFGASFQTAAQAAADMARVTGMSMDEAVKAVVKLQDDPVKATKKLNEAMNYLSPAEAEQIKHLMDIGDNAGAAAAAITALANAEHQRAESAQQAGASADGFWSKAGKGAQQSWEWTKHLFEPATLDEQLDQVETKLKEFGEVYKGSLTQDSNNQLHVNTAGMSEQQASALNSLLQQRVQLKQEMAQQDTTSLQVQKQTAQNQKQINDALGGDKGAKDLEADLRKQEAEQKISYDKRAEFEMEYWGQINQTAATGSAEQVMAWGKVQELQKQMDTQQLEAWKRTQEEGTAASRKAAAAQLTSLEEVRDATVKDSQQRIDADQKITAAALRLYGQQSQQYKRALDEQERDQQEFNQKTLQANVQLLDQKMAEYNRDNANAAAGAQLLLDQGKITAQQLAAIETQLAKEKMLADIAFVTAQENLYIQAGASEAAAAQKAGAEIIKIQQDFTAQITNIQAAAVKAGEKDWNGYATAIGSSMKSAVTGMLFQGNTLKQGMESIGESIVGTFVDKTVDGMVKSWFDGQASQTAATAAGVAQRNALQLTGAKEGLAISGAMNEKSIMNAAYTGAANAYQALAGIPVIGPVLGAAAAAATFIAIEGYDNIASAAGGWGDIPSDQLAMVHKNEMILPAHIAQGVRDMTAGGGSGSQGGGQGGGDTHIHNHYWTATDGPSVKRFILKNADVISQAVAQKTKNMPQLRR